jgi:hypothetical protein
MRGGQLALATIGAITTIACTGSAIHAVERVRDSDVEAQPRKALKPKAIRASEKPLFFINDNRITFAYFMAAVPGYSSKVSTFTTAFTHYDAWAYGTNSFSLLSTQYDRSAPTAPCSGAVNASLGNCAGATYYLGSLRSTLGWNELFDTNAFSAGPLKNISFVAGADASTSNLQTSNGQITAVAGLQFAFGLPYNGFLNVSPVFAQRMAFGANKFGPSVGGIISTKPPYIGFPDGVYHFSPTWGLELNYYVDLGFLPESLQYFSISGRASIRGADGTGAYGPYLQNPLSARTISYATEPVRFTFDAGKFFWGQKHAHLVDLWAAWRYDKNIIGYNEALDPTCVGALGRNLSCSDNGVYYGMTMKLGADLPGTPSLSPFGGPFFRSADNTLTFGVLPNATSPGETAKTIKQVYAFTHNDSWAYGTNMFYAEFMKSDHRDPSSPCTAIFDRPSFGASAPCAGNFEVNAKLRSTFGFNEMFNTTAFRAGPLRNISFELGGDARLAQSYWAPDKKAIVAGLQFALDLPYRTYANVAPLYYQESNHSIYAYPNNAGNTVSGFRAYGSPPYTGVMPAGFTGTIDGNLHYRPTWAVEIDYGSELAFLPENLRYLSLSGRVGIYGPKGNGAYGSYTLPATWNTKTEINAEPIKLSFDVSKALWGEKYAHFFETFVAYRYWQNKFGLDAGNTANRFCRFADGSNNNSCTEHTVYAGITAKF